MSEVTQEPTFKTCNLAGDNVIPLGQFISEFGNGLLSAVQAQNPPIYDGINKPEWSRVMNALSRKPFDAQQNVVQAVCRLLIDHNKPASVINGEMGTGKTMMAISAAAVLHNEGYSRSLVISPPHLVYKWRREIKQTIPDARVWILNGSDTLCKLIQLKAMQQKPTVPEFFVMGRVRMRMGFNWKPAFAVRHVVIGDEHKRTLIKAAACPQCGALISGSEGNVISVADAAHELNESRRVCKSTVMRKGVEVECGGRLWMLTSKKGNQVSNYDLVAKSLLQIPTIGKKGAEKLLNKFGHSMLSGMLSDNVYEFVNLMDDEGEFYFSDSQAKRMERAMANMEFSFGQGGYQPTEFIKRHLPNGYFGSLIIDEGHEYKNDQSAQGQAMGVLARKCTKKILLTGTLMGGYADDLFYLLYRLDPNMMLEDGYVYNGRNSLGTASMCFMREHGILKDIFKETTGKSFRTANGKQKTQRSSKGPGFGPLGIMRYILPVTVFLKLKDIGGNVLPPYREHFIGIEPTSEMRECYDSLSYNLSYELKRALRVGDTTLLGVVLNVLLAWPETCFRDELVKHPRTRQQLAFVPAQFSDSEPTPKELELLRICKEERRNGRRVLVYTVYTGTRDTANRLKNFLASHGFNVQVLRSSVEAAKREDWLFDQVDRGVDIIITNPELVKTGLDMLEFPTIVYMQSGFNVYTLQQASRRSWRIGQKKDVDVYFLGYNDTAQMTCLELMAKKIAVSQSTSGDMPDSGLDILNQSGDSVEVALAKQLLN